MARTSRKRNKQQDTILSSLPQRWNVALYARLSIEDNGDNSDSITTQLEIMEKYIATHPELKQADIYVDNGFTGTNFDRPNFQRMMNDIQQGRINCVITKDLSRLGRNYIETSELIEKIFPFLNVRYISINNQFDTANFSANMLSMALENILNDMYAKDISKKVYSALDHKMKQGQYIGNYAPYGYLKDPQDKNHLIPDPNTRDIVKMIYELRASGMSYMGINKRLNELCIPSPSQLKADSKIKTNFNQKNRKILWNKHMITIILQNPVYCGHMLQRKNGQCLYKAVPYHNTDTSEQIMVYHTHAPIISEELFKTVQEINTTVRKKCAANSGKYDHLPKQKNIYGKRFHCAKCGATMKLIRSINQKATKAYFTMKCPTHDEHGKLGCSDIKISKSTLDQVVLESIRSQIALLCDKQKVLKTLSQTAEVTNNSETIVDLEKQIKEKRATLTTMYITMKDGNMSEKDYLSMKRILHKDIEYLQSQISMLSAHQDDSPEGNMQHKLDMLIQHYENVTELSSDIIDSFIDTMQLDANGVLEIKLKYSDTLYLWRKNQKEVVA